MDAIIVGSGPNGLAAAITLAREGWRVQLLETSETVGGGTRTAELTLPGFRHDVCSAIHPLGMGSPFFRSLDLEPYGLQWIQPELPVAHPFEDGTALAIHQSLDRTRESLGRDGAAYGRLLEPLVRNWDAVAHEFLGPLRRPRHPLTMVQFGLRALWPAKTAAQLLFRTEKSRALFAGLAAHAIMPLEWPTTAAFGLILATLAHVVGWPLPRGGSQAIADALAAYLLDLGGEIVTGHEVKSLRDLPDKRVVLLDVTPRQVLQLAGEQLPERYRRQLQKYRYGPGIFKIDWALSDPIPWRAETCRRAGTVHIGPSLAEICESERLVWQGKSSRFPYTLVTQQSLFDNTRAPANQHTGWAYCHVPHGSTVDMTQVIEQQMERFAPGFRDCILARHTMNAGELQRYNPNYIGGDINGGVQNWRQLFTRPVPRVDPYSTPLPNVFLCSSATPPGGGVHGMCGYFAAQSVMKLWKSD
ncbi:MAG: NAD(P)/FAD-dependent oxidoreductase [Candidatus Promineifilaceae bacterium]|nr:NAD(P)/FAD-dependent oxidoreductase [Candidatus Promineifilaceae bacterium]